MWTQLKLKSGKVNDSWKLCLILSRLLREREVLAVYGAVSISQLIINHIKHGNIITVKTLEKLPEKLITHLSPY